MLGFLWGWPACRRFPTEGGTGAIWKGVAKLLPQNKQVGLGQGRREGLMLGTRAGTPVSVTVAASLAQAEQLPSSNSCWWSALNDVLGVLGAFV